MRRFFGLYFFAFEQNTGKYKPEKLRMWTLVMQI